MRLIDADSLFNWGDKKLSDAVKYGNKDEKQANWSHSTLMMYEIADEINDAPTIEPVKRGEWTDAKVDKDYELLYPQCSACGAWALQSGGQPCRSSHCPTCGADMRTEDT